MRGLGVRSFVVATAATIFIACATTAEPLPTNVPTDGGSSGDGASKPDGSTGPSTDGSVTTDAAAADAATKDSAPADSSADASIDATSDASPDAPPSDAASDVATLDAADGGCPGTTVDPTCVPTNGNLALCGTATATSEYNSFYAAAAGNDGNVNAGWYSVGSSCPAGVCPGTDVRWEVELNTPRSIGRLKLFGNRDYDTDYDVLTARFELLDANGTVLYGADVTTSRGAEPNGDVDHVVAGGRTCVKKVRVIVKTAETGGFGNDGPGFGELEAYEN